MLKIIITCLYWCSGQALQLKEKQAKRGAVMKIVVLAAARETRICRHGIGTDIELVYLCGHFVLAVTWLA